MELEEGGSLTPVTIAGLSQQGYLLAEDAGACRRNLLCLPAERGSLLPQRQRLPPAPGSANAPFPLPPSGAGGERYELHPDGNSLDFFRGLVRRKLPA